MPDSDREPMIPSLAQDSGGIYAVCGHCGQKLVTLFSSRPYDFGPLPRFCPMCGREVKWQNND